MDAPELKEEVEVTAKVLIHYRTEEQRQHLRRRIHQSMHLDICGADANGMYYAELLKDTISIGEEKP